MTVSAEGSHRAVIRGHNSKAYVDMLSKYAQNTDDQELLRNIPKIIKTLNYDLPATCATYSLPEADGSTTHFMTVEIYTEEGDVCALYYHSNSSGELGLLTRTGEYMESLIIE